MKDDLELLVAMVHALATQVAVAEVRVATLERAYEARLHTLELGLARLSHAPENLVPVHARLDDRGVVVLFRASAA